MRQMKTDVNEQYKVKKPTGPLDLPRFVWEVFRNFWNRWAYVFRLVWESSPPVFFLMIFMSLFNGLTPLLGAFIGREILNVLAAAYTNGGGDFSVITWLLVSLFIYMFLTEIASRVESMITRISGEVVSNHIKLKIMEKAKHLDMASFDMPEFYGKMENANREAGQRPISVLSSTFMVISSVISIVSFIVVLAAVSPWAPLAVIAVSVPATIINFIYRNKNVEYMFSKSKERRQMSYYADIIVNKDLVKEMKLFNLADTFIDKYRKAFDRYFKGLKKLILHEGAWNISASFVSTAVNCLLFIFIASKVFAGEMQIGDYSLYTGALSSISTGVIMIIFTTANIYEGTLFINNLISFMAEKETITSSLTTPRKVNKGQPHAIEFRHVSFQYPGTEKKVIEDVSFSIAGGESAVLVGLNGAGKTTLLKLLLRLYDPTEGTILLDNHDIREYDPQELYTIFGTVFQDFGKYAATAGENIAFGEIERQPGQEALTEAARAGNILTGIHALPQGFDTPLMRYFEAEGVELSIGQWQKLSIARAFYSDSDILILDEPTASLDPIAEQEIYAQFDQLCKNKTALFVSHRLSSAVTADKIIVVEYGKIAEIGSHQELMARKEKYYALFTTQAKRYIQ